MNFMKKNMKFVEKMRAISSAGTSLTDTMRILPSSKYIKYITLFVVFIFILSACKKNVSEPTQTLHHVKYNLYDSVIREYNNGVYVQEFHYPINRAVEIDKIIATGEILYNTDTFRIYDTARMVYTNGGFPLLGFNNDSIAVYKHLGGVAYQTWEYLFGKEIN